MVKLAYLSAAFLAATMNLFPVVYASLANSTVAMDTKPEPTGIVQILAEAEAVINLFTAPDQGKTFLKQLTLVLDECAPLPGAYGVVHWKKDPTAYSKQYLTSYNLKACLPDW